MFDVFARQVWIHIWIAVWAGAAGHRSNGQRLERIQIAAGEKGNLTQNVNHLGASKPVKNVASIPVRGDQTGFAKYHQVLRYAGLANAQHGFQVADTGFLRADHKQDLDARRLADP